MNQSQATTKPRLVALPPRLRVHEDVHEIVNSIEGMHRCADTADGCTPDEFTSRLFAEFETAAKPVTNGSTGFLKRLLFPANKPPARLALLFLNMAQRLQVALSGWDKNQIVGDVECAGTSLSHDYQQAGPPGNVRIGPFGSSSVHGAVLVFAHWLHEQVLAVHGAAGRSTRDAVEAEVVRDAWARAIAEMSPAEQDPELWNWVRQELDAEYARLCPMPAPNATTIASLHESQKRHDWIPPNLGAAILVVLERAGDRGEESWAGVSEKLNPTYTSEGEVRRIGSEYVHAGFIELRGRRPKLNPTITKKGTAHLDTLRQ